MKHLFTTFICCLLWKASLQAQQPIIGWASGIIASGGSSAGPVAVDKMGNIYSAGMAYGNIDFDPDPVAADTINFHGNYLRKLDGNGNLKWVVIFDSIMRWDIDILATDAWGNVYATGIIWYTDTVDLDPSPGVFNVIGSGYNTTFILKLDASGNFKWATTFKNLGSIKSNQSFAIAVDAGGNIFTSGEYWDSCDFDPGLAIYTPSTTGANKYCCKLDSSGNLKWVRTIAATDGFPLQPMVLDNSGNIYLAGAFADTVDFDPGPGSYKVFSIGRSGSYLLKLDNGGNFVSVNTWQTTPNNLVYAKSLSIDNSDNIYIMGEFTDLVIFSSTYSLLPSATYPIYLAKFNSAGIVWAKELDVNNKASLHLLKSDNSGRVYLAGNASSAYDFDPGSGIYHLPCIGSRGSAVSIFDSLGAFKSAILISNTVDITDLDVNASGSIYITGQFKDTVDFDPSIGTYNISAAVNNGFIARYVQNFLPLNLISFSATAQNKRALLQWQTAQEQNTSHFIIQRSLDGREFTNVGKVLAKGNVASGFYRFAEDVGSINCNSCHLYYRLQMVDKDGKFTYSKIVTVRLSSAIGFTIYPNPATNFLHIQFGTTVTGKVYLEITDINGKIVMKKAVCAEGETIALSNELLPGSYMVSAICNEVKIVQKLIIAK